MYNPFGKTISIRYFPYFIAPRDYWEKERFSWWYRLMLKIFHNKCRYYYTKSPIMIKRTVGGKYQWIESSEAMRFMCHCSITK